MMMKTRYFVLGAAAVLVVGLCTGLVAYYGGLPSGSAAQMTPDASEFRYIPADAAVVGYANVREVMDSDLRRRLQDGQADDQKQQQRDFEERTGINLETDVDRVVAAMVPKSGDSPGVDGDGFAIVSGSFDATKLEAFARDHGGTVEEYKGVRIVQGGRDDDGREEESALAFLDTGVVAVGDIDGVRLAIDTRDAGQGLETNTDMMRLIDAVEPGSNAWAVGRFEDLASQADLPETVASQIPPIQWFSASGQVNDGLRGTVRAETRDEQAANDLREVVRGFLALARMQAGAQPELGGVLEGLQIGGDGSTVAISFSLTGQAIDALMSRGGREADE